MAIRHGAGIALLAAVALAGCATQSPAPVSAPGTCPPCPSCPSCPGTPAPAPSAGAKPLQAARWLDLPGWLEDDPSAAWGAFLRSCQTLRKQPAWAPVCADAQRLNGKDGAQVRSFFETWLVPHQVVNPDDTREGLITGYYEPLIRGSRTRSAAYRYPLYTVPDDLLTIEFGDLFPELKHMRLRGRLDGRKVVPYYSREELSQRESQLAGKVLLWVADAIELFFLQVQGSGRVELDNGGRMRVGYADQNGHPYQSIGRWLVDRGEITMDQASMDGIKAWARANAKRLDELLNANPSFVFFRQLPDGNEGPIGALGVPLTEGRSLAVDPRTVPLGVPVFLATTRPSDGKSLNRLMLAQDTGGAIKGAVRADFYWGSGPEAGVQAGRMRQTGRMWLLLPRDASPK